MINGQEETSRRAACSKELDERSPPRPHDVAVERIAEAVWDRREKPENHERYYTPTPRAAWREVMGSFSLLKRSIRNWLYLLPCKFWWHSPKSSSRLELDSIYQIKVCCRCGAWRDIE